MKMLILLSANWTLGLTYWGVVTHIHSFLQLIDMNLSAILTKWQKIKWKLFITIKMHMLRFITMDTLDPGVIIP